MDRIEKVGMRTMKNKLISIGYMGIKQCYLNIPEKEAIRRYNKSEGRELNEDGSVNYVLDEGVEIQSFEFDDEFGCYEVWDLD